MSGRTIYDIELEIKVLKSKIQMKEKEIEELQKKGDKGVEGDLREPIPISTPASRYPDH